jgi:hypothetical protein
MVAALDLGCSRNETRNAAQAARRKRALIKTHQLAPRAINIRVSSMTLWQIPRKTSTSIKSLFVRLPSLAKAMITPEPMTIPRKKPASSGKAALFESLSRFISGWRSPAARSNRWASRNNAKPTIKGIMTAASNSVIRTLLVSISRMMSGQFKFQERLSSI